ncbi:MAG: dephospho-CoA kinase [Alphaproteobacteria bacterium]|nr:dephospho-CoA kinase [Alphaproteobacteria bacterium]
MIVIGITGSIGMGKTTAANMLREATIPVHDSDAAVHRLLGPKGKAVPEVGKAFPEALKTNTEGETYIDRSILGKSVFADRSRKKTLEGILHPLVREDSDRFREEMQKRGHRVIALDIPLLFEIGEEKRVDVTICVTAPPEVQRERVLSRHGMTSEKFDRIVAGQLPDAEKRKRADFVVESDKGLEAMRQQLIHIVNNLLAERAQV